MTTEDRPETAPLPMVDELLAVLPRLVERTRSQAELARSLVGLVPCVGPMLAPRHAEPGPGVPEHERIDVLSVLAEDGTEGQDDDHRGTAAAAAPEDPAPAVAVEAPDESSLPIQDYDSLAASQVVPRLANLGPVDLTRVRDYEAATRRRQTILNRVAQLLDD